MFKDAVVFDQDISVDVAIPEKWSVANVVDMTSMFEGAAQYNNVDGDDAKVINLWSVGKVTSFTVSLKATELTTYELLSWIEYVQRCINI